MDQEAINRNLREQTSEESPFQKKLVALCKSYIKSSSKAMSKYHGGWELNDAVYRGYRGLDKNDRDAVQEKEPPKLIVPVTFAQVQTAVSFVYSTLAQREYFYELGGTGPEDSKKAVGLNRDLQYQLNNQKYMLKLYCFLLDTFKYGFGVQKIQWTEERVRMRGMKKVPVNDPFASIMGAFGIQSEQKFTEEETVLDVLAYQGNKLTNVSPYNFYPDPSVTLANFQDGLFVAHDEETSRHAVTKLEGDIYHGTKKIPAGLHADDTKDRTRRTGRDAEFDSLVPGAGEAVASNDKKAESLVLLEMELTLVPKDASKRFEMDLGDESYPVKFLAVIGNDRKLIRFERSGYLHDKYNYGLAEYSPDANSFYNPGLSDTIFELQNLVTFYLNSHVASVRQMIKNRFIADPARIEVSDIKDGSSVIRLKQGGIDISRVFQQVKLEDITSGHANDVSAIMSMIQLVTGVNENALGQFSSGRRSATEARAVNAGAATRLKMHSQLIWQQGLDPIGRLMLANTRQGRSKKVYEQIVGKLAELSPFEETILAREDMLAGGYDFVNYDGTLPSDRQFQANVFRELFEGVLKNPQAAPILGLDPVKMLDHIARLYGINNMSDFRMDQLSAPQNTQVVPDEVALDAAAQGAAPVDIGAEQLIRGAAQ